MRVKITCPFRLPGSHEIHGIGFRGGNNIELTTPFRLDGFFGKVGTNLEVIELEKGKYGIVIDSDSLLKEDEQIDFLERVSEYLSFLINKRESNPHYGTNFVELEWFEFKAIAIQESHEPLHDTLHISDALAVSSTRTFTLDEEEISRGGYHDVLRFYYDGLRAEHAKSKYFHWFLILEYLENSKKYRALFNSNMLFDENEKVLLMEVADKINDEVKKGAIFNLLSRTKEFRNYKLFNLIMMLGITEVAFAGKSTEVSEGMIKTIVDGRNSLFHGGKAFPEAALWGSLFPLVTQVVDLASRESTCFDA